MISLLLLEEQISSFVDFDQHIIENYSTEPNRSAPNPSGTYNRGRIVLDNIHISGNY